MALFSNNSTDQITTPLIGTEKAIFIAEKLRSEFIFNMAKLEGNTLSFAEAETVIYGVSVAGKKMSELHQLEHIRDSWDELLAQVKTGSFNTSKYNFCNFNYIVAQDENHDAIGGFRKNEVAISGTDYLPPLAIELDARYQDLLQKIKDMSPVQAALTFFMDASRNQFFGDGNKRSSQLMMNGILMTNGYGPFTISPKDEVEYRTHLIEFYKSNNPCRFYNFLLQQQSKILSRFRVESLSSQKAKQQGTTKTFINR